MGIRLTYCIGASFSAIVLGTATGRAQELEQVRIAFELAALALLHYWRALGENRRRYWLALGADLGLLLLASYAGALLLLLIIAFTLWAERGRAALGTLDPLAAGAIIALMVLPHLLWIDRAGLLPMALAQPDPQASAVLTSIQLVGGVVLSHAGLVLLLVVGGALVAGRSSTSPSFEREPVAPFARTFVYFFALGPVLLAAIAAALLGMRQLPGGTGWLVLMSGLAVIVAAGDTIRIHRQRVIGIAWLGLLIGPPLVTVAGMAVMPWLGVDLRINEPAVAMGRFFNDRFEHNQIT